MAFSKTLISQLRLLAAGDKVAYSSIPENLVKELTDEDLLIVSRNGSRRSLRAIDGKLLIKYLMSSHEEFRCSESAEKEICSRASQASATGNSKLVAVRSCPGFPVNSFGKIECRLNGEAFTVNPQEGSFSFICDWRRFEVPEDAVVVGIENMENFRMIRRQTTLFEKEIPSEKLLFVSRYPQSTDLRCWLQQVSNHYVHFGDFDLAGINIFLTEFRQYLGEKATFLIPSDIEARLQNGSSGRYNDQYERFHQLHTDIPRLQKLIDLINRYHRCYDQEGYIV